MVFSTGFHSTITRLMPPNVRNADFAQRNVIWVSRFMKIQTVRNVSAVENAKMSVQPALSIQEYVPKPEFNFPWSSRFCGAFIGCEGADIRVLSQGKFICNEKEKRYKRNIMFLFAEHYDGILKILESKKLSNIFRIPSS